MEIVKKVKFNKNITNNKHIFDCETIKQFYLMSFILEEAGITDSRNLIGPIKKINSHELEVNKKRYIYDDNTSSILIFEESEDK